MNNSARKSRIIRMFFALVIASLFGFLDQAIAESNFSIIKSFPPTPYVSLPQMTEGGGGDLYGNITTNGLPSGGYGSIYKLGQDSQYNEIFALSKTTGYPPAGRLVKGSDGAIYGITIKGGEHDFGTIFRLTTSGEYVVLHSFDTANGYSPAFNSDSGSYPVYPLAEGGDGNYYGLTTKGGENDAGVIYKISASGIFTLIHSFTETDKYLSAPLIRGSDGGIYGTLRSIGDGKSYDAVFKVGKNDVYEIVHRFIGSEGSHVVPTLTLGPDGAIYGSASGGGDNNNGTVFRLTQAGEFTVLHYFNGMDGTAPGPLTVGDEERLFGATNVGGQFGYGTLFSISTIGDFSSLHSFNNSDGRYPMDSGTLTLGREGLMYGVTQNGGAWNYGTIFVVTSGGNFLSLHDFSNIDKDGIFPNSVTKALNGDIYGTTQAGGLYGKTYIFKIIPPRLVRAKVTVAKKSYDGNTIAQITECLLTPAVNASCDTSGASARFVDAQVGENKQVIVTGLMISGAQQNEYVLERSNISTTATITRQSFSLTIEKTGQGLIASTPDGINCGQTCSNQFPDGTSVSLTATPNSDYIFSGWEGACNGKSSCAVTMNTSRTVTAKFIELQKYPVRITKRSTGVITSEPAGILCGGSNKQCISSFSSVKLIATPKSGYELIKWNGCQSTEGNVCYIKPTGKMTVSAVFKKLPKYNIKIIKNNLGSITSLPAGLNCPDKKKTCTVKFTKGTEVTLTPVPQQGSSFSGWTGACSGIDVCTALMDGNKGVGAIFQ